MSLRLLGVVLLRELAQNLFELPLVVEPTMLFGTTLKLLDVPGCPSVKLDLPVSLRIGDRLSVNFRLTRKNAGRTEVLDAVGDLRVTSIFLNITKASARQMVEAESLTGVPFKWRAVKTPPVWKRQLSPAKFPRTPVGG